MKKTLFILCALLLTAVGASAQIPYEFHAEDWIQNPERTTESSLVYNEDNTITVTATNYAGAYTNNISLGNSWTYSDTAAGITTNGYTITSEQSYFVIVGSDLSTDKTADTGDSFLWWLNGWNQASQVIPDQVVTLTSGNASGQTLFAWDISEKLTGVTANSDGTIPLSGWTCFGLTSTDETSHKSTISYIGFCTADEVTEATNNQTFDIPTNTYVHACTANESVWTLNQTGGSNGELAVDTWAEQSDDIMSMPFMQYWVSEGADGKTYLSDATISHDELTDLAAGVYEVSMDIRIIDYAKDETGGNAKIGAGTKFIANGVSEDLLTGSEATEDEYGDNKNDEVYGTYTLTCVVGEAGTLDISLDVKDATYSWIMWKNLKVKYLDTPSLSWDMTSAGWGTLVLPFAAEVPSGLTAYTAGGVETTTDGDVLTLTEAETLEANTPYILSGDAKTYIFTGTEYVKAENNLSDSYLTGTFVDMTYSDFSPNSGQYVLQMHTEDGDTEPAFYPITDESTDVTLSAYHCYLTYSETTPTRLVIGFAGTDDEATAIEAVESAEAEGNGAIYDLSGRKVSKAVKGVYIQNGKKVLVK